VCTGAQQPLNKLTDLLRLELAQATYTEVFTFALVRVAAFALRAGETVG
jgi:hypothetical protein